MRGIRENNQENPGSAGLTGAAICQAFPMSGLFGLDQTQWITLHSAPGKDRPACEDVSKEAYPSL
jgi:hypothetical protein